MCNQLTEFNRKLLCFQINMEDLSVKKVPMHLQSSQNRILIKGGTVVNATGSELADVYIEDRLIKQVGSHLDIPGGTRIIDATGKLVMPGGIDTHTVCISYLHAINTLCF